MGWVSRNGKWYDLDKFVSIMVKSIPSGNGGCCGGGTTHIILGYLENMEEFQIAEVFSSACEAQQVLDAFMEDQY